MFQSAEAQRRSLGGLRPGNVSPARLLTVDAVQSDLKLTDQQKAKAAEINEALTAGRHELFAEVKKDTGNARPKVAELERKRRPALTSCSTMPKEAAERIVAASERRF